MKKKIVQLILAFALIAFAAQAETDGLHASSQPVTPSADWVKALSAAQDQNTKQLFIVAAMGIDKTTAYISMHQRNDACEWEHLF